MDIQQVNGVLWQKDLQSRADLIGNPLECFAYYTGADTAFKILSSGRVFMRDTRLMNDSAEISYGRFLLDSAIKDNETFSSFLAKAVPEYQSELRRALAEDYGNLSNLGQRTFITSLSRHNLQKDYLGRLSMWRGYGGVDGVALLIGTSSFNGSNDWTGVYSSPVVYTSPQDFRDEFTSVFEKLLAMDIDWATVDHDDLRQSLSDYFLNICINYKHPGFAEEREWRIFSRPDTILSPYTYESTEIVRGVPQRVLSLDIGGPAGNPASHLIGALVGPARQQDVIREALVYEFLRLGLSDAAARVQTSPTPWVTS